ncbi:MAG TPA: ABC transporter ATP-binding protein [Vicinamibacterales bacterium]|nr:ABC transporter ATP-binding protein [Vicinamibacterales bacterium]
MHDEEVLGKAYDSRLMRRLLGYLRPYRAHVAFAVATIVANSALQLAPPYLTKIVIDEYIPARDLSGLTAIAALYLGTLAASFAFEYAQTWTMQTTGQRVMFDLRMQVFSHLHRLDVRFYDRNPVGRLMTRVTGDVDVLNELFTSGVVSIFGDAFTLFGIMAVLVWMDWRLALVAFSVLPLIALITQWFRTNVRDSYRTVRTWIARINAYLQERITGTSTVQLFRREARDYAAFDEIDRAHRDANVQSIFYYAVFYPAVELVSALAASLIIWYGGGRVMENALTLGSLVAFLQYSQRFFRPISDMSEKFNVLQGAMASSERIFALLDTPVEVESGFSRITDTGGSIRLKPDSTGASIRLKPDSTGASVRLKPDSTEAIAFENVTFSYVPGEPVLKNVSFRVEPGQRVALVGATGSGKTTIVNLLLRFYDVEAGRITIDGVDIRQMDLAALRAMFGLVLQDVHLFSGTIADNVRLGHAEIDDDQVKRALEAVHAWGFVSRMSGGLSTPVAERGSTLSVGQKQLLSFARALAFDPRVLVLDEATSSVDTETELLIRDALKVVMRGRTTIAIAHRLSTIQDMDRILVLHKGELREAGTHQELLAARGLYHRLYQLQFKDSPSTSLGAGSAQPDLVGRT